MGDARSSLQWPRPRPRYEPASVPFAEVGNTSKRGLSWCHKCSPRNASRTTANTIGWTNIRITPKPVPRPIPTTSSCFKAVDWAARLGCGLISALFCRRPELWRLEAGRGPLSAKKCLRVLHRRPADVQLLHAFDRQSPGGRAARPPNPLLQRVGNYSIPAIAIAIW